MKKVLIMGSTGYLGPKLTSFLLYKEIPVFTINRKQPEISSNGDLIINDFIKDELIIRDFIRKNEITTIINLVWVGSYGSDKFNRNIQKTNLNLKKSLISISKEFNEIHLIDMGTISECQVDNNGNHESEYSRMKEIAKNYMIRETTKYNIKFTWVILGNIFGGEDTTNRFIINTLKKLLINEDIILNSDGSQWFYPVFINTVNRALCSVIENDTEGVFFLVDSPIKLKEFILSARSALSSDSKVLFSENKVSSEKVMITENLNKTHMELEESVVLAALSLKGVKNE